MLGLKYLPKIRISHAEKNSFTAMKVTEDRLAEIMADYYVYISDCVYNGTIENVTKIADSHVMEFLTDYNFDSINELVLCCGILYYKTKESKFIPNLAEEALGEERTMELTRDAIMDADITKIPGLTDSDQEKLHELLQKSIDPEFVENATFTEKMEILETIRNLKNKLPRRRKE